jgi:uncharacterized protein
LGESGRTHYAVRRSSREDHGLVCPTTTTVIALSTLDPRAPLVLDTHELGRRPGSQRLFTHSVPAPADLGIDVLEVPEGSPIELHLRLEAVMEGVLVTGTARAHLVGECTRCLDPLQQELEVDLQELYTYDEDDRRRSGGEDDDTSTLEGDLLDLEPVLRDAVVLALPFGPLCREDCPGLCPECGARLADDPEHDHGEAIDPRWEALTALTDERPDVGPGDRTGTDEE